jgi:uncharacterized membrane protein YdjX (TVP38/TMEM64 family)
MPKTTASDASLGYKPVLKGLLLLALFAGAVTLGLESKLADRQWILDHVQGRGVEGWLLFLGINALATGLGLPRQVMGFLGGYAYGWFWGAILSTLGTALGCALDFVVARTLAREFVLARFGKRVAKLDAFLRTGALRTSLAIRLFPVGHNLLTSVAAGVTSISAAPFILGSAIGYLPQNLVFALFGAGINAESTMGRVLSVGTSVVLLVGSAWLGLSVYRSYKRQGVNLEDEDTAGDSSGAENPDAKNSVKTPGQ